MNKKLPRRLTNCLPGVIFSSWTKGEEERDFHWMQGVSALDQEKSATARWKIL
jgi:hypothetical protein